MKKNNTIKLSVLSFIAMSSLAFAGGDIAPVVTPVITEEENYVPTPVKNGFYIGLGLAAVSTRDSDASMSFTSEETNQDRLGNISLHAGYEINKYVDIEGRYTASISHEDMAEMTGFSFFVKPKYKVDNFTFYALAGYGKVKLKKVDNSNVDASDGSFQWGLGGSYNISDSVAIFADYTSLANDMDGRFVKNDGVDTDAFTLGVIYRF